MTDASRTARSGGARASLYAEIPARNRRTGSRPVALGAALGRGGHRLPRPAAQRLLRRAYSGINVLILWGAVFAGGFSGQNWLTDRQAQAVGGNVRKGEPGTTVVYADRFIPDDERRRARDAGNEPQAISFLKRFTVFNCAQCEDLPNGIAMVPPIPEGLILPRVEAQTAGT